MKCLYQRSKFSFSKFDDKSVGIYPEAPTTMEKIECCYSKHSYITALKTSALHTTGKDKAWSTWVATSTWELKNFPQNCNSSQNSCFLCDIKTDIDINNNKNAPIKHQVPQWLQELFLSSCSQVIIIITRPEAQVQLVTGQPMHSARIASTIVSSY